MTGKIKIAVTVDPRHDDIHVETERGGNAMAILFGMADSVNQICLEFGIPMEHFFKMCRRITNEEPTEVEKVVLDIPNCVKRKRRKN